MRFFGRFFLLLIGLSGILSCASAAREKRLYTNITDDVVFFLLDTDAMNQTIDMPQYLSAEFRDQKYFFIAWVKADETGIEMSFFNELGASIGELTYKDGKAHFTSTVIPRIALRYLKPEYIIADFQLCFYDPVILGKALEEIDLVLEIINDNRRILSGDEVIIEITKSERAVKMQNFLRGYSYTMEGDFN